MPKVIRHALYQKVSQLKDLQQFRDDFMLTTGLKLEFVDDLGQSPVDAINPSPLCHSLQSSDPGKRLCQRAHSQLLAAAKDHPAWVTCDAGLHLAAVPVRVSGIVVGYLKFGGVTTQDYRGPDLHRIEHLLRKADVPLALLDMEKGLAQTRVVPLALLQAYLRILAIAAQQLALRMTAHLAAPTTSLPHIVEQACRAIRRRALTEDLHLADVARECRVSVSHLSRIFHHATGLTSREYIARWRAEHAYHLLVEGDRPITQIAYESGFQSLSQFNRVFRAAYGKSPRRIRDERPRGQAQA